MQSRLGGINFFRKNWSSSRNSLSSLDNSSDEEDLSSVDASSFESDHEENSNNEYVLNLCSSKAIERYPRAKELFQALQRLDLEGVIDVIEADESDICKQLGARPPQGMRKVSERSPLTNVQDAYGQTPLLLACRIGAGRVVMGLLLRGADARLENKLGVTPLIACAQFGNVNAAKALLDKRLGHALPDVQYENKKGKTVFDHILPSSRSKLLPVLEQALQEKGTSTLHRLVTQTALGVLTKNKNVNSRKGSLMHWVRTQTTYTLIKKPEYARELAARKIQQQIRNHLLRRKFRDAIQRVAAEARYERKRYNYAVKIQRQYRRRLAQKLLIKVQQRHQAAVEIQKVYRGYIERKGKAIVLAAKQQGLNIWQLKESHRGWMARYYLRAVDVFWERAALEAIININRVVRGWLARCKARRIKQERSSVTLIQKYVRGYLARLSWRENERNFNIKSLVSRRSLEQTLDDLTSFLPLLHVKREVVAAELICRTMKPYAKEMVLRSETTRATQAAVCIQSAFRGMLGRRKGNFFRKRHAEQISLLENCLSINGLHTIAKRQTGTIGCCKKCPCGYFMCAKVGSGKSRDICKRCGHHEANHLRKKTRDELGNHTPLLTNFNMQLGPISNRELQGSIYKQRKLKLQAEREVRSAVRSQIDANWAAHMEKIVSLHSKSTHTQASETTQQDFNIENKKSTAILLSQQYKWAKSQTSILRMQKELKTQLSDQLKRLAKIEQLSMHPSKFKFCRASPSAQQNQIQLPPLSQRQFNKGKVALKKGLSVEESNILSVEAHMQNRDKEQQVSGSLPCAYEDHADSDDHSMSIKPLCLNEGPKYLSTGSFANVQAEFSSTRINAQGLLDKRSCSKCIEDKNKHQGFGAGAGDDERLCWSIKNLDAHLIKRKLGLQSSLNNLTCNDQDHRRFGKMQVRDKLSENHQSSLEVCDKTLFWLIGQESTVFPVQRTPAIVGRSPPSDIIVSDKNFENPLMVSKRHCILHSDKSQGVVELRDISTNGTFVNNVRVGKNCSVLLKDGDTFSLGMNGITFILKLLSP